MGVLVIYINLALYHSVVLDELISEPDAFCTDSNNQLNGVFKSNNVIMRNWEEIRIRLEVSILCGDDNQGYPYHYV